MIRCVTKGIRRGHRALMRGTPALTKRWEARAAMEERGPVEERRGTPASARTSCSSSMLREWARHPPAVKPIPRPLFNSPTCAPPAPLRKDVVTPLHHLHRHTTRGSCPRVSLYHRRARLITIAFDSAYPWGGQYLIAARIRPSWVLPGVTLFRPSLEHLRRGTLAAAGRGGAAPVPSRAGNGHNGTPSRAGGVASVCTFTSIELQHP